MGICFKRKYRRKKPEKENDINPSENKEIITINIINKMSTEINIIYNINKDIITRDIINIFGIEFVENNKKNCKMVINDKEYRIREEYNVQNCGSIITN